MGRFKEPFWVGDRYFDVEDIAHIKGTTKRFSGLSRHELAATLCENLPWKAPNGRLKLDACRLLLMQMEAAGVIQLPGKQAPGPKALMDVQAAPVDRWTLAAALAAVRPVTLEPVPLEELRTFNATLAAYHYLGYRRPIGAHQRYWLKVQTGEERRIAGAMLFGAAAKAVLARDRYIGWTREELSRYRVRIINQSRFLILPGIAVPHLASHALALAARRLPQDWAARYGYVPVLFETFVEPPWRGTCYLAANWVALGDTAGRGRQDRAKRRELSCKTIFVYPLRRDWRQALCEPLPAAAGDEDDA